MWGLPLGQGQAGLSKRGPLPEGVSGAKKCWNFTNHFTVHRTSCHRRVWHLTYTTDNVGRLFSPRIPLWRIHSFWCPKWLLSSHFSSIRILYSHSIVTTSLSFQLKMDTRKRFGRRNVSQDKRNWCGKLELRKPNIHDQHLYSQHIPHAKLDQF